MSAALLYLPSQALVERMMRRVEKRENGCWIFTGAVNSKGYGCVSSGRKGKNVLTHRLAVMHRDGSVPEDMTIDHLCNVKRCVNPDHLEVVTRAENTRRRFTRPVKVWQGVTSSGEQVAS